MTKWNVRNWAKVIRMSYLECPVLFACIGKLSCKCMFMQRLYFMWMVFHIFSRILKIRWKNRWQNELKWPVLAYSIRKGRKAFSTAPFNSAWRCHLCYDGLIFYKGWLDGRLVRSFATSLQWSFNQNENLFRAAISLVYTCIYTARTQFKWMEANN